MSLSHGKRYISAVDEENNQRASILDILNIPSQSHVVSITESSQDPDSTRHHASVAAIQQDKISNLQISYNSLLDKYQRKNAAYLMNIRNGKSRIKYNAKLQDINNSLINIGTNLLDEIANMQTNDTVIQQNLDDQRDQMQGHMGYLHEMGNTISVKDGVGDATGYHILSWGIISVLVGSLVYRSFKGK
jgi:hypothetical protein